MNVCLECGRLFDDEDINISFESHGLDSPPYERIESCPYCNGNFIETMRCHYCGNWLIDSFFELPDYTASCSECFESIKKCRIEDLW